MDLYTMNENFIPDQVIDEFTSAVWTERFSSAGDCRLLVPALPEYIGLLQEGKYLGVAGSKEVMQIQTQSIDDGMATIVGEGILTFLDERMHWAKTDDPAHPIGDYTVTAKLGELVADRVDKMVINPVAFTGGAPWSDLDLQWALDKIEHLELGATDHSGVAQRWTIPVGPLYSVLQEAAAKDGLGISLYLESADPMLGYVLKFTTYRGVDRTSDQSAVPLIRLSPDLESLSGLKEIRSIKGYKNVVYVVYQNKVSVHYEDPANIPEGLARRVLVTDAEGEPVGHKETRSVLSTTGRWYGGAYEYTVVSEADIAAFRAQHAKDALANHNYIRSIDGEVSRTNEYVFGTDYGLGDILELEGLTGLISKARVTEYIRAQDNTGERAYPTLSVIS